MADPFTLATIAIGATVAAGAVKAFGEIQGGYASQAMYNYQAGIAKMNQQIAKQNANWATEAGGLEAARMGMKTRFEMGKTKAIQAGRGLAVDVGSPALVRESQHEIGLQDQAMIRSNAAKRAYGFEVEGVEKGAQASLYEMAGEQAVTAGYIGAAGTVLGTVGSVAGKWGEAKQKGIYA